MRTKSIEVVYRPITELKASEYNPRKHTKDQAEHLTESIERFGMIDPIICNSANGREDIVVGGHFRLEIAKELGMEEVPVVYVNISDLEKEKELNLRLNKNTGEFDIEKLKQLNFDLLLDVGFDQVELDDIWNEKLKQGKFDLVTEMKKIKDPETQLGDIIELGNSRLICGDSTKPETLQQLFGDERASMIMSDPIYNISIDYNKGIGGKQSYGGTCDDNKTDKEYKEFLKSSMEAGLAVTKDDAHVFYWSDETYIWLIQTLYRELGITNKRVCLWLKNSQNPVPSVAFNKCYEPCTYGTRGKPSLTKGVTKLNQVMNAEMTTGNDLVQQVSDFFTIWPEARLSSKEYEHSTMKPPALYEKAIRRCTNFGDIILDSFSGSGSTLMASEKLGRRVFAVEIEPKFCDLTIKRFEAETGIKAKIIRHEKEVERKSVS
ncbi:DNA methyltransferase [Candidatus Pacebacteria bacterium]|nr:DNA methyltransferase [Candidatus Paceibacterota bacterium]